MNNQPNSTPSDRQADSVTTVAARFGVSPATIYREINAGRYVGERNDGRPGRKSLDWEVNPAVHGVDRS